MSATTFDTLGYFERLKEAGVPEQQAKAQADTLRELIDAQLVTKNHLDIRLAELKNELLRWMTGIAIAQTALLVAVLSLMR